MRRTAKRIVGALFIWACIAGLLALSVPVRTSIPTHLLIAAGVTLLLAAVILSFIVVVAWCFDVRL